MGSFLNLARVKGDILNNLHCIVTVLVRTFSLLSSRFSTKNCLGLYFGLELGLLPIMCLSLNFVEMFFLTFIIPLRHIHDVGDFLSPRKQVFK